jgi:hypothetical protein
LGSQVHIITAPTAPAIARQFARLDVLYVGAGTTGTLMGCARYFCVWHRRVRILAVDSVPSVIFGGPPGRRMIPGLSMTVPSAVARRSSGTRPWLSGRTMRETPSAERGMLRNHRALGDGSRRSRRGGLTR